MLILTRRINESIMIGPAVEIQVLGIGHGRVKLGFCAPPELLIRRQELDAIAPAADGPILSMPTDSVSSIRPNMSS